VLRTSRNLLLRRRVNPVAAKPTEDNRKRLLYAEALVAAFQEGEDSGEEGEETEDENL
jgi:hypothetical protein